MSQETATGAGNLDPIEEENAPEENGKTLGEDGGTPQLNNGNATQPPNGSVQTKTGQLLRR